MGQRQLATVHFSLTSLVFCVFSLGLAVGVVIAVGMLFVFQLRSIARNRTGIEDWIMEKAKYRREDTGEDFVFPYDLGYKRNVQQVASWSCAPIGDGIVWEINDTCDQYTLTVCVCMFQNMLLFCECAPIFVVERTNSAESRETGTHTYLFDC